ncbi:UNVERIFIED_ORG: hypothetical protein BDU10_5347 [Burkholderia sp. CF145]
MGQVWFVAGKGLKKLASAVADGLPEGYRDEGVITVPTRHDLPYLAEGLESGAIYGYAQDSWFTFGRRFEFYDQLEKLADFANFKERPPGADQTGQFREIFRGGDFFGPVVSAKLAADFSYWEPLARARGILEESFYAYYKHWKEMFEFAANDGAVWLRCS